jgi:Sec-independent protein translocase protein TatA
MASFKLFNPAKRSEIVKNVLHNKYVLYFVFVVALMNLLFSVVQQDFLYCTLFILIGFLVAFFNKNMIVVLVLTMSVATVLRTIISGSGLKVEGFKEGAETNEEDSESDKKESDKKEKVSESDKKGSDKKEMASESDKNTTTTKTDKETKLQLMNDMKQDAVTLMSVQKDIINGFQTIEPHMNRAESLIGSIQETAKTIQGMRGRT